MSDDFFQTLRQIQKKERSNGSLARVGADFYKRVYSYINELKRSVGNDPFANEHYLLKDTQRIATEICERREHKITDAAVMNIHRSYHLFKKGKPQFDLLDTTPLNLTEEEEKLYFSLIDSLKNHRGSISLDKFAEDKSVPSAAIDPENPNIGIDSDSSSQNSLDSNNEANGSTTVENSNLSEDNSSNDLNIIDDSKNSGEGIDNNITKDKSVNKHSDAILSKLNQIKNAKVIPNEKSQSIEAQIANQKNNSYTQNSDNSIAPKTENNVSDSKELANDDAELNRTSSDSKNNNSANSSSNSSSNSNSNSNHSDLANIYANAEDQFVDLDKLDNDNDYYAQINQNNSVPNQSNSVSDLNDALKKETILLFKEVEAIVGVDEKIYGPFNPQDLVILPNINAQILVKSRKARLVKI